ncbi:hypothetical protein A0H81_05311 [Grifola frondosa]|uniref:Uncharacterized protein n=1 Tax=Grifola frondosa TaxID=5627 RepID=A0A1C7MF45_GRIFR|nr:hypothetical protein A0H81_05311 [Grifola frondosa]
MAGRSTKLSSLVGKLADNATLRAALIACAILLVDVINAAFDGGAVSAITTGIKGVVGIAAGTAAGIYAEAFISSTTLFSAGAATMGVLGVAAGAIAGFVVGLVVGIVLDVGRSDLWLFETSQRKYWDEYMTHRLCIALTWHRRFRIVGVCNSGFLYKAK